ncbi:unnamed protein product [Phaeothamnion confervicola]
MASVVAAVMVATAALMKSAAEVAAAKMAAARAVRKVRRVAWRRRKRGWRREMGQCPAQQEGRQRQRRACADSHKLVGCGGCQLCKRAGPICFLNNRCLQMRRCVVCKKAR